MSLKEIHQFLKKYQYDPTKSSDRKKVVTKKPFKFLIKKLQQAIQEHDRLNMSWKLTLTMLIVKK